MLAAVIRPLAIQPLPGYKLAGGAADVRSNSISRSLPGAACGYRLRAQRRRYGDHSATARRQACLGQASAAGASEPAAGGSRPLSGASRAGKIGAAQIPEATAGKAASGYAVAGCVFRPGEGAGLPQCQRARQTLSRRMRLVPQRWRSKPPAGINPPGKRQGRSSAPAAIRPAWSAPGLPPPRFRLRSHGPLHPLLRVTEYPKPSRDRALPSATG